MPETPTDSHTIALQALLEGLACIPALRAELAEVKAEMADLRAKVAAGGPKRKNWYDLTEAAEALDCSPRQVRKYIQRGLIRKNLTTRHIKIPAEEIEKYQGRAMPKC